MVSGYKDGSWLKKQQESRGAPLQAKLLAKSASVRGFFLLHYRSEARRHMQKLGQLVAERKLISVVDPQAFQGLEQVADAVEYLFSGKNIGKVTVRLNDQPTSKL